MQKLELVQEKLDLEAQLQASNAPVDINALENAFIENAARYGKRKGISYAAWRAVGVPAAVLKRAVIGQGPRA